MITKLSPTGTICVFTYATANIIVDVAGYVPAPSDYVPMSPVRFADTRAVGLLLMVCSRVPVRWLVGSSFRFLLRVVPVFLPTRRLSLRT